ncbi:MAG: hypothetical protein HQ513_17570 [Rhodospirillales bacterium]|nr:hypothetical protein [Rhodospirillales bacterium]
MSELEVITETTPETTTKLDDTASGYPYRTRPLKLSEYEKVFAGGKILNRNGRNVKSVGQSRLLTASASWRASQGLDCARPSPAG